MKYKDKQWLSEQVEQNGRSFNEIAKSLNASVGSVIYFANKFGVESTYNKNNEKDVDIEKVERLYHEEGLSGYELAKRFDASRTTLYDKMREAGIEVRPPVEELSGEEHPTWDGGWEQSDSSASFYWSNEWRETRSSVLNRDGHECTQCGESEARLVVHHWIPIDEGGPKHDMENLATVCQPCHNYLHEKVYLR